jgi:hypothetical protein
MNCRDLEPLLAAYAAGTSSPEADALVAGHVRVCSDCRTLLEALRVDLADVVPPADPGFLADVLARTTGSPCAAAESRLGPFIDGLLESEDAELLTAHLEHCRACRALTETMVWMRTPLREMAGIEPDAEFARDVLAATVGEPAGVRSFHRRLRAWWLRAVDRPRFAWELAYAATLVIGLLFGTPSSPLREVPPRALEIAQTNPYVLVVNAWPTVRESAVSAWNGTGAHVFRAVERGAETVGREAQVVGAAMKTIGAHGRNALDAAVHGDVWRATVEVEQLVADLRGLRRGEAGQSNDRGAPDSERTNEDETTTRHNPEKE